MLLNRINKANTNEIMHHNHTTPDAKTLRKLKYVSIFFVKVKLFVSEIVSDYVEKYIIIIFLNFNLINFLNDSWNGISDKNLLFLKIELEKKRNGFVQKLDYFNFLQGLTLFMIILDH